MLPDLPATDLRRLRRLWADLGIDEADLRRRGLPFHAEATVTVVADHDPDDHREIRLLPGAAKAWRVMREAAAVDGIVLWACSGFRDYAYQAGLIRRKLDAGAGLADALAVVAAPGQSEHHTGRAVDIATPESERLGEDFAATPAFRWLAEHAAAHGFVLSYPVPTPGGITAEPWHWRWEGAA
jgi:D-alanyl-D-alanine carboxypeptidase